MPGTAGTSSPGRRPAAPLTAKLSLSAVRGGSGEIKAKDCRYGRRRLGGGKTRAGAEMPDGSEDGRNGTVDRFSGSVGARAGSTTLAGGRASGIPGARAGSIAVEGDGELNKADMVSRVASRASLPIAEAAAAVDGVLEALQDALARGDSVALTGFGTFSVKSRPARTGRNPGTGESIEITASTAPSFKAGKALRDVVR